MGPSFPINIPKDSPFGLYNIPFGIFSTREGLGLGTRLRAGTAVGGFALELDRLVEHGFFDKTGLRTKLSKIFLMSDLNSFASLPAEDRSLVRATIIEGLTSDKSSLFADASLNNEAFIPLEEVYMHLPMKITDYTDSFSSLIHAQNCARPLKMPVTSTFYEYPMAYNGRLSSLAVSGSDIVRPQGFFSNEGDGHATFQLTRQLDFEIELGAFISKPILRGETVNARNAGDHIFGYVLLNDWSARDVQKYEMPPLGPFHSKGFMTTISPWIVTLDALRNSSSDPPASASSKIHPMFACTDSNHGLYDIALSAKVSRKEEDFVEIVQSNLRDSYWSPFQQVAYQSSSGGGLHTGDLLGIGTISSPVPKNMKPSDCSTCGCLIEVFAAGLVLPDVGGKPMSWVEDGDRVTIEGWFKTPDGGKAGFGGLTSLVIPAKTA